MKETSVGVVFQRETAASGDPRKPLILDLRAALKGSVLEALTRRVGRHCPGHWARRELFL